MNSMTSETVLEITKSSPNWNLFWKDVDFSVAAIDGKSSNNVKKILSHCSGQVKAGEVIAILGPSGAGKTTLLNVLSGRDEYGTAQGLIMVNGRKRSSSWKRVAAYVDQEDILYADLTVRETVLFAANLRLPAVMGEAEKIYRTDEVIRVLGLNHVANNRIGSHDKRGISGGERKRVSIAIELVSEPGIIFLDEPTSGLDSFIAATVSSKIKELAKIENKAVLLTIHQPRLRILEQFDKIILLSQGQIIFFGTVPEALDHFRNQGFDCPKNENPADFFLDLITIDRRTPEHTTESYQRIQTLISNWEPFQAEIIRDIPMPSLIKENDILNAGLIEESFILSRRFMTIKFRDWRETVGSGVHLMLSLIGLIWASPSFKPAGERFAAHALFQIFLYMQLFTTCVPYSQAFLKDRDIIRRERSNSTYSPLACYVGKFVSIMSTQTLYAFISSLTMSYACILNDGFIAFLRYFVTTLLLNMASIAFVLIIAAAINSAAAASRLGTMAFLAFFLFGGLAFDSELMNFYRLYRINYFSPSYYAYNAFKHIHFKKPDKALHVYIELETSFCWIGLIVLTITYSTLSWIALKFSTKPRVNLN